jgi:hypothetical protein
MIQEVALLRSHGLSTTAIAGRLHIKHQQVMWIIQKLAIGIDTRECRNCHAKFVPFTPKQFICTSLCRMDGIRRAWREKSRKKNAAIRKVVIEKLGGKCSSCPIDDHRVLQINHLNGGGNREYKSRGSRRVYLEIIDGKREGEFDLRCANCNILYSHKEWP